LEENTSMEAKFSQPSLDQLTFASSLSSKEITRVYGVKAMFAQSDSKKGLGRSQA
jgi:hypothetical protein